ncbi:hypothetical protein SBY92_000044 [Candida maltosa Xu316]
MSNIDYGADDPYTAATGLLEILFHVYDNPDRGTGIHVLVARCKNLLGNRLPPVFIHNAVGKQVNLFGKYPLHSDYAPSILFATLFAVIAVLHLAVFSINFYKGHYFFLNLVWSFIAVVRLVSFVLRATWTLDITMAREGIAGEILLVIPSILLISTNLILAQRLFTWRHPVGGSRRLFWIFMISLYAFVAILIVVAALGSAIPYLYFLSTKRFLLYINLNRWISIMVILYTLTAVSLIGLSFWFPTKKDEKLYTYQPWWIESFSPFYFVKKGAAQEAEESFMKRNSNHRHAIRVIAATHHHYKMVKGLSNERGDLKHNVSLIMIIVSTILLFISSLLRSIVVFQARTNFKSGPASEPVAMYFGWGVFEVIINLGFIVGRADLRFYRPDILPAKVRAIITAEQTTVATPMVSEEEYDDDDNDDGYYYNYEGTDDDELAIDGFHFDHEKSPDTTPYPVHTESKKKPEAHSPDYADSKNTDVESDEFKF